MSASHQELAVRRSIRHDVVLGARWAIARDHEGVVKLSQAASRDGWVEGNIVDFGVGGAGLLTSVFAPRRSILTLCIPGAEGQPPLLTVRVRVQRVVMTDRRPMYMLGLSFEDPGDASRAEISRLLERFVGSHAGGACA